MGSSDNEAGSNTNIDALLLNYLSMKSVEGHSERNSIMDTVVYGRQLGYWENDVTTEYWSEVAAREAHINGSIYVMSNDGKGIQWKHAKIANCCLMARALTSQALQNN